MKVDKILYNGNVFNTFTKKFELRNIAIKNGQILWVSQSCINEIDSDEIIDLNNKYIIPGLIDIHMHIESSMTTPTRFSDAVLPCGTTTVVADAHEIANVYGIDGIHSFLNSKTDLDIFYAIPSSVPSTNEGMETTGGKIGVQEAKELLENNKVICLGEVMDYNGLVNDDNSVINQIINTIKNEKPFMPIEGHIPKLSGIKLAKFLYKGIMSDHTQQNSQSIVEKISNGVFLQFQRKSVTKENMDAIIKNNLFEYACFVTDDVMADDLRNEHLNGILKLAVSCGMPLEQAIYMCTYTPARYMGLRDRGAIAPGKVADLIILDNINDFSIETVYKMGKIVKSKEILSAKIHSKFPKELYNSIKCKELTIKDLNINITNKENIHSAICNVIEIEKFGTFTNRVKHKLSVENGMLNWESSGLSLLMVMERYGKTGEITYALVKNTLNKKGAVATTWAHDNHNLMVMGNNKNAIIMAQHKLLKEQGGYVVCDDKEIKAFCPLPIGGIISDEPIDVLGYNLHEVRKAMEYLGYINNNVIMSFSTLSLPVSPSIKVTDKGIFDSIKGEKIPLVEELDENFIY